MTESDSIGSPNEAPSAPCPFCFRGDWLFEEPLIRAVWDNFPVSLGHGLIVTRRHVSSWFEATMDERAAIVLATDRLRSEIEKKHAPMGFNIGINSGEVA